MPSPASRRASPRLDDAARESGMCGCWTIRSALPSVSPWRIRKSRSSRDSQTLASPPAAPPSTSGTRERGRCWRRFRHLAPRHWAITRRGRSPSGASVDLGWRVDACVPGWPYVVTCCAGRSADVLVHLNRGRVKIAGDGLRELRAQRVSCAANDHLYLHSGAPLPLACEQSGGVVPESSASKGRGSSSTVVQRAQPSSRSASRAGAGRWALPHRVRADDAATQHLAVVVARSRRTRSLDEHARKWRREHGSPCSCRSP